MTVQEFFGSDKVDLDFVEKVTNKYDNPYWHTAFEFVEKVWDRAVDSLTHSQNMWLSKILDDCVEMRILKKVI